MRYFQVFCLWMLLSFQSIHAQLPKKSTSVDIYHSLQKLNFLGSALYIAAHPDDENTRLISYLSNEVQARTAYLSLTRGDGGQNLIGPELRELLGVLRTEELLAARRIDGGEQFFTRANDFGYSKDPKETLKIWDKDAVLSDMVWIIRNFQPDVIINRFDHRTPGTTHGHHTSSAMLSVAAFDLANNATAYPEQLKSTDLWQPKRLFFNTSWWFYGSEEKFEKARKNSLYQMDVGVYYPMWGVSNNEIAALASSQHLCQGFGRLATRGSENEYVELLKGEAPQDKNNIFDGINTTWSRIDGGKAIGDILYPIEKNFNFKNPSQHLPKLIEAYQLLQKVSNEHWKKQKTKELKNIIAEAAGLYLEASANGPYSNPGNTIAIKIEAINRSDANIVLRSVSIPSVNTAINPDIQLTNNKKQTFTLNLKIPDTTSYTSPYWLRERGTLGMYKVNQQSLIGKPETPPAFMAHFVLAFNGYSIPIETPVIYDYARPDKGELVQPFQILPEATASFKDKVLLFPDQKTKEIPVTIKAFKDHIEGEIQLCHSNGWTLDKEIKSFKIAKKGDEQRVVFTLTPPENEDESLISPILKIDGRTITKELHEISYDHIPTQSVLLPSEAKVVRLNIQKAGETIGYIQGVGDEIPKSLEQIGYTVQTIDPATIQSGTLNKFGAIVVGIRAYNVVDELKFKQHFLLDYVKHGGNLIIQYNTVGRSGLSFDDLSPYHLHLSRDRVTDENSEVQILDKDNSLVNFPNSITQKDFDGWVQERGLYFPDKWGAQFAPILSMKDEGEANKKGSLLVAPYGAGNYIYTGLSFFRQLPAGVPGAYKLFANMLSVGKNQVKKEKPFKG